MTLADAFDIGLVGAWPLDTLCAWITGFTCDGVVSRICYGILLGLDILTHPTLLLKPASSKIWSNARLSFVFSLMIPRCPHLTGIRIPVSSKLGHSILLNNKSWDSISLLSRSPSDFNPVHPVESIPIFVLRWHSMSLNDSTMMCDESRRSVHSFLLYLSKNESSYSTTSAKAVDKSSHYSSDEICVTRFRELVRFS